MKRLGKWTGRIYTEEDPHSSKECCTCITDEQAKDEAFISAQRTQDLIDCIDCSGGCLMSKGASYD